MRSKTVHIIISLILLIGIVSCSTTKHIPDGEVLYTGIKKLKINAPAGETIEPEAKSQVVSALETPPNNALLGSSSVRFPIPFGLWMYNLLYTEKEKGFKKWLFDKLASEPILISKVDPSIRCQAAEMLMKDNGYFNGTVTYKILPDKKNPKKAKIEYIADFPKPYRYSSVEYLPSNTPTDSLLEQLAKSSLLKVGTIFNVNNLEAERARISDSLRNNGFYYFQPDFISYLADSTQCANQIALRVMPKSDLPKQLLSPWRIAQVNYSINNSYGQPPTDTIYYRNMGFFFRRHKPMRLTTLYNSLGFKPGDLYSLKSEDATQIRLNRLNAFKYVEMRYSPQDTILGQTSLNVDIDATMDLPMDAKIELNVTTKSNNQTGPGMIFGVTRRNLFGGGEMLNTELSASYEWQTGAGTKKRNGEKLINSYEFGVTSSLVIPRLIAPNFMHSDSKYPSTTTLKLNANLLSRAGFFRLMTFGCSGSYDFKTSNVSSHTITPFSLTYSFLMNTTSTFDTILMNNKALQLSFDNQFIPSMGYTYTYDDGAISSRRNHVWWQSSVTQAGNLLYGTMSLLGNHQKQKDIFGNPFSQFVKLTSEIRYYYKIWGKHLIASRFMAGVLKPYLNSQVAPYSEQFFIGGANSIRAFGVRSLGPGSYHPKADAVYSYLDQTGNLKLEANVEYRFPIMGSLNGALFVDAGNIWLLKAEEARPGGNFTFKDFGKDIALGTGAGLRFDITYLVLRFDVGVPIHAPYDTGKRGYYNIDGFFKNLGYHLAIGYPF